MNSSMTICIPGGSNGLQFGFSSGGAATLEKQTHEMSLFESFFSPSNQTAALSGTRTPIRTAALLTACCEVGGAVASAGTCWL